MKTLYRVKSNIIKEVQVDRYNDLSFWEGAVRYSRWSSRGSYYETREAAELHIVSRAEKLVNRKERAFKDAIDARNLFYKMSPRHAPKSTN